MKIFVYIFVDFQMMPDDTIKLFTSSKNNFKNIYLSGANK